MPAESLRAMEVLPDDLGLAPVLEPGEYCRDTMHGLWHFCTPDKGHFITADVTRNPETRRVTITKDREFCGKRAGPVGNPWTVKNGWWVGVSGG